jgi:membrane protein YdbS with pleckstrin-like domain
MSDGDAEPDEPDETDPESASDPRERTEPRANGADGDERASDSATREGTDRGVSAGGSRGNNGAEEDPTTGTEPLSSADGTDVTPDEIDVDELTGPVRKLDPRVRYVWVLGSVVGSLVLAGIVGVAGFLLLDQLLVGPAVFLVLLALGAVMAVLRYRSWSYEVREDSLYLERGVLTHTRTVVPYVRIQHVDASRGPVERTLGLATAVVYTAGSRGADVSIPGLTTDRADDLQERLKRLAIAAEGEDAV